MVANAELLRRHHDHTIYVLCSVREGMPKSLIEAMASGLICVGTKVSGIMELIEDGRTGYLIDGFDADAIEQRLRWVLDNFDPEVGRRASAIVHRNNSLDRAVELESGAFRRDHAGSSHGPDDAIARAMTPFEAAVGIA